jgi:hypothetical protein
MIAIWARRVLPDPTEFDENIKFSLRAEGRKSGAAYMANIAVMTIASFLDRPSAFLSPKGNSFVKFRRIV